MKPLDTLKTEAAFIREMRSSEVKALEVPFSSQPLLVSFCEAGGIQTRAFVFEDFILVVKLQALVALGVEGEPEGFVNPSAWIIETKTEADSVLVSIDLDIRETDNWEPTFRIARIAIDDGVREGEILTEMSGSCNPDPWGSITVEWDDWNARI
jgi:hypothetical protein